MGEYSIRDRVALRARLEARRSEIEGAIIARVYAIADPGNADPAYLEGLRDAVSVALDYELEAIESGEERALPPPPTLRAQARMAARSGIALDTVLRRYVAGYTLLGDFLVREAIALGLSGDAVSAQLLEGRAALFDRLLAAVSEEYADECASHTDSSEQRRAERIERLLAGEQRDRSGIGYDFEGHHLGLVADGRRAAEAIRGLAAALDCRMLIVRRGEESTWAWLGSRRPRDAAEVERQIRASAGARATFAIGEPAAGLDGWRLTHRQAAAALPVALRRGDIAVRYADVALLASIMRDTLLATSLHQLYLAPLESERDRGEAARETLRAYCAAERNVSSTAAALGVTRRAVSYRLQAIEGRLGRRLPAIASEIEIALTLEQFGGASPDTSPCN